MELNIEQRREAARINDKARVGTTKLAMNAVFGKTMENIRKHVNIELLTSNKFAKKRIAKPNFKSARRFHNELLAVQLSRTDIELKGPIQSGFTVLEHAKGHMTDGYYNDWKRHFPKSELLFTDTDSFCVAVEHPDVYAEMATFQDWFDFSEYPRDHPLYDDTNRKVSVILCFLDFTMFSRFYHLTRFICYMFFLFYIPKLFVAICLIIFTFLTLRFIFPQNNL